MKVGLFVASQWPASTDLAPQLGNMIEQVRAAKAAGFDSIFVAQHFLVKPMQMFQTQPLLARLMAEGEGMMFGPAIMLLPLLNPVLVAEEAATLDWFSGGRYVLPVGLGYRDEEFEAFGMTSKQRTGRLVESIEVMRKLWTGENVTHHGKYYDLSDVGLSLKPKKETIPIWVGGATDPAIKRAARVGDAWLVGMNPTVDELKRWLPMFKEERAAAGLAPAVEYPACRECYVGAQHATALSDIHGPLFYKYQAYASWGNDRVKADDVEKHFDQFCQDRFIIGDEASVRDEMQRYRDEVGITRFVMRMQWPGMDQALVLKSIERMGRIVASL